MLPVHVYSSTGARVHVYYLDYSITSSMSVHVLRYIAIVLTTYSRTLCTYTCTARVGSMLACPWVLAMAGCHGLLGAQAVKIVEYQYHGVACYRSQLFY